MSSHKLNNISLLNSLPDEYRRWLISLAGKHPFSFQQLKMTTEMCADMVCWGFNSPPDFCNLHLMKNEKGKRAASSLFQQIQKGYENLKNLQKSYPQEGILTSQERKFPQEQMVKVALKGKIMGACPVASEDTRCCNLKTLDAVQQCGFDCSYCSIQSFYHGNQVRFIEDLGSHLDKLELDPEQIYHIGTGQSSDSLMWGNRFELMDSLCNFTRKYPKVILEMKSKSSRVDYFLSNPPPPNIIFTWSLNTPVAIQHEEKGSASLDSRLQAARKLADSGSFVGFHFHPIIWYKGWQDDYSELVAKVTNMFDPKEVVMISLGTLTFIKPVIKKLRQRMVQSNILQMPMEEIAGKLSYPIEIKKDLFSTVYNAFPHQWKQDVFFYMCMEDKTLWQPVFNRTYETNEEFEDNMLQSYAKKIGII